MKNIFSVSPTKKVEFTKGNLYWDGKEYHFEKMQTDYPTEWDPHHVGHFYWAIKDSESYKFTYLPYEHRCSYSRKNTNDKFFCDEDNSLTVDGISDCFALSQSEWYHLIYTRTNAAKLCKYGVSVDGKVNCMIIAPDGFSGTLKSSYTLNELDSLGLICLPAAGFRYKTDLYDAEYCGNYWSSTPGSHYLILAYNLCFSLSLGSVGKLSSTHRYYGRSIRLVKNIVNNLNHG